MSYDPNSPEFKRGEAVGQALGKTYRALAPDTPRLRELTFRMAADASELVSALGFEPTAGTMAAAMMCALTEWSRKAGEP